MTDSSINLVQYALVGGGIFVLIAVGIIALFLSGSAKREAKKEAKRKKKQARKEAKVSQSVNLVQEELPPVKVENQVKEELQLVEAANQVEEELQPAEVESKPLEAEKAIPILLHFYKVQSTQKGENKKFLLENSLTIGRNTASYQWTITGDPTISGHHCKIYQRGNEVYILDLNSTNGTYVNGKRVRGEMKLTDLDKIRIGQSEYRIGM